MFLSIFKYELKYWIKQPSIYLYTSTFFFLGAMAMAGTAELFDPHTTPSASNQLANSPVAIYAILDLFNRLIVLLLPTIIGVSVYRDFKTNMHSILYSYPFAKRDYLFAKFLSSFLIVTVIVSIMGMGLMVGTQIPGVNESLIAPFNFESYFRTYAVFIIPNMLLFGALVFAVTTLTRNVYAGFVLIVLIFLVQSFLNDILQSFDNEIAAALLSPFGNAALSYYARYWELAELNGNQLPFGGLVMYNRLIWLGVASIIFAAVYRKFNFSQQPLSFSFRKKGAQRVVKNNFGSVSRFRLSPVAFNYSFIHNLKTTWTLSRVEFRYIIKSWMFISVVLAGVMVIGYQQVVQPSQYGFKILPVTWQMLNIPTLLFSGIINLLTYLYAGMLVQRAKLANTNQLVDTTPIPSWSLLLSKFIAILKMQFLLLSLIIIMGITAQIYHGYYNFEIPQYLFKLYVLNFLGHIVWAFASVFVQTLFTNPYVGLFILIVGSMGIDLLPELGIESKVFHFNQADRLEYSDMNGFGAKLPPFFWFKSYWSLFGFILLIFSSLLWTRGLPFSFKERLSIAKSRIQPRIMTSLIVIVAAFSSLGAYLYTEEQKARKAPSTGQTEDAWFAAFQKEYGKYEHIVQPRITSVNINMDIYPKSNDFKATGSYTLVNKSSEPIDTLVIKSGFDETTSYDFGRPAAVVSNDEYIKFSVYRLEESMAPGDSLTFTFEVQNEPNSLLRTYSNVLKNGSFIGQDVFPRFGYSANTDKPHPSDSLGWRDSYQSKDSDTIDFEAVVSTSKGQTAIAPGKLQKQWTENDRSYFHYKMNRKMKYAFSFNSGYYEVLSDSLGDVSLDIFYHKGHEIDLERMMSGLKDAMVYNTAYFSEYDFDNVRIIEFPITQGTFATLTGNAVPTSEVRFLTDVDDSDYTSIDMPFYVAAHELSHHWWGGQLQPANAQGALMLTESLSEYTTLKILERKYGIVRGNNYRKLYLDSYLRSRGRDTSVEPPLMLGSEQRYINYVKGSLVFHALSDYLGEDYLNSVIKAFLDNVRDEMPPYPTTIDFVEHLKHATPDSLKYFIKDAFETVTISDNQIVEASSKPLNDGRYEITLSFLASKYRSDGIGQNTYTDSQGNVLSYYSDSFSETIQSLPLADYIEIGVFGDDDAELYLKKHKITQIDNTLTLIVDKKPTEVGVDPYFKLIDRNPQNNRKEL